MSVLHLIEALLPEDSVCVLIVRREGDANGTYSYSDMNEADQSRLLKLLAHSIDLHLAESN